MYALDMPAPDMPAPDMPVVCSVFEFHLLPSAWPVRPSITIRRRTRIGQQAL
jgi:hypothetical protein